MAGIASDYWLTHRTLLASLLERHGTAWPAVAAEMPPQENGKRPSPDACRMQWRDERKRGAVPTDGADNIVQSLVQFAREKKREHCPICKLTAAIRQQIAGAGDRKISLPVQLEWLQVRYGVKVTAEDLAQHKNRRHDAEAAA